MTSRLLTWMTAAAFNLYSFGMAALPEGNVQFQGKKHQAGIRRPPEYRLTGVEPRKDAAAICLQQPRAAEVAAGRQQAVGRDRHRRHRL